jgi:hypothetical protein
VGENERILVANLNIKRFAFRGELIEARESSGVDFNVREDKKGGAWDPCCTELLGIAETAHHLSDLLYEQEKIRSNPFTKSASTTPPHNTTKPSTLVVSSTLCGDAAKTLLACTIHALHKTISKHRPVSSGSVLKPTRAQQPKSKALREFVKLFAKAKRDGCAASTEEFYHKNF